MREDFQFVDDCVPPPPQVRTVTARPQAFMRASRGLRVALLIPAIPQPPLFQEWPLLWLQRGGQQLLQVLSLIHKLLIGQSTECTGEIKSLIL